MKTILNDLNMAIGDVRGDSPNTSRAITCIKSAVQSLSGKGMQQRCVELNAIATALNQNDPDYESIYDQLIEFRTSLKALLDNEESQRAPPKIEMNALGLMVGVDHIPMPDANDELPTEELTPMGYLPPLITPKPAEPRASESLTAPVPQQRSPNHTPIENRGVTFVKDEPSAKKEDAKSSTFANTSVLAGIAVVACALCFFICSTSRSLPWKTVQPAENAPVVIASTEALDSADEEPDSADSGDPSGSGAEPMTADHESDIEESNSTPTMRVIVIKGKDKGKIRNLVPVKSK